MAALGINVHYLEYHMLRMVATCFRCGISKKNLANLNNCVDIVETKAGASPSLLVKIQM